MLGLLLLGRQMHAKMYKRAALAAAIQLAPQGSAAQVALGAYIFVHTPAARVGRAQPLCARGGGSWHGEPDGTIEKSSAIDRALRVHGGFNLYTM